MYGVRGELLNVIRSMHVHSLTYARVKWCKSVFLELMSVSSPFDFQCVHGLVQRPNEKGKTGIENGSEIFRVWEKVYAYCMQMTCITY